MKRYLSIALLACLALSMSARDFEVGEKLYFNAKPSSATWWKDGTSTNTIKLWGRLVGSSAEYWIEAKWYGSDNCYLEIPDDDFLTSRNWSKLVLYRCDYYNRNDVKHQTGEIDIDASYAIDKNYIQNFYYGTYKEEANWWNLTFTPVEAPTGESVDGVAKEVMEVCTSSAGDPLSLQPILAGDPLMYDYNHSAAHAWFKWNGSAWTALDGQVTGFHSDGNAWGYEGGTKIKETIGAAGSSTLYFLWTEKPSRRRFLEVDVTEDCDATLEITDFGVVISNLDVDNSTYTLNGIVAFNDEAVISSPPTQLRISVTDTKGNHYVDYVHNSPDPLKTPFVFSLPGLYADGATGLVAKAEFVGTGYSKLSESYTAPDASDVEIVPLEQAYNATTTFTAPGGEDGFKWSDGLTSTTRTVPAYNYDETLKFTYYDYEKLPAKSGDLIKNGDFSDASFDYGTPYYKLDVKGSNISEYNYWGKDVTSSSDFYDTHKDGGQSISGGMSIIKDANKFWKRYTKKISPKKETHYALFDADNSGSKKAWYIVTDATTQPDLKLAKGTNYLFSFWVANINNYGEMNNAAKLQFAIRYKQGGSWSAEELLGNPIDLNHFQDNIWHQNSYVYTAPADANDVEIMVRDLNASANPGGNDFALDDIRFSPIVAVTPAAKSIKRYVVTIYEAPTVVEKPVINIEDPACGSTKYNMTVTVNYSTLNSKITPIKFELIDDVYGTIYKDEDFDPVANPNSITIPLSSLAADNKIHNLTAKITRKNGKGVDKGGQNINKYTAPGVPVLSVAQPDVPAPGCNVVAYDLDVTTTYAYQTGTQLLFYWDGILHSEATQDITYGASTSTTVTLTNLPYDGEDHTLVVKTNNTTLDCTDSKTVHSPHQPVINSVSQSLEPDYVCGEDQYHVSLTVNYTNALGRKICVKDGTKELKSVTANTSAGTKATKITDLNFDFDTDHNLKVYFEGHETCAEEVVVKSPAKPKVTAEYSVINKDCSKTTYDLEVTVHYINQNGTPHVDVDGKEAETYSPDEIEKNQPEERSLVAVVKNLPADGGTAHKLNVSFNESHGCSLDPIILTGIPHQPVINSITQSGPAYVCGEKQYHDTLKVNYTNALGDKICVKEGTDVIKSVAAYTGDANKEADILLDFDFDTNHNLKVYFEGHEECAEDVVVKSPVKPALSATSKVVNTACNKTTYDLEVTVKYTNQNGKLHVDVDGKAAKEPKPEEITENSTDELTYVAVVKDLPADEGTAHTLNVSFSGDHGCHPDPIILTGIPHRPVINSITQSGPAYVCGENQFHDTLKVTYTNALGKKICVKEGTEVIKSVKAKTSADKDSTIIPLDLDFGADHNLKVYFEGHEECAEELTIVSPAKPALTVTPNVINPNCDVTTYSLRLKLNYTNQRGATILANVDGGTDVTKANAYVSVMESKEDSIQIDGLLADGKLHKFNLRFDDSDDCDTLNVAFNAPFGPKISTVMATVQDYACGDEKYKVKVNVSFENGQGKKLIIEDWKGTQTTITPQESNKAWHEFEYAWETPATHEYKVYFVGAETCDNHKASFKSPAEPKLKVTPTVINPDCDVTTYSLRLDLKYINQRGSNILANVDGGADVTKANAHKSEAAEAEEFILIENLPADGKEHTFNLRFDDSDDCDTLNVKFTAPYSPQIGTAKAAVQPYKCGDEKYKVNVEVHFANGQGHNLIIEDWKGNKQSISTTAADTKKDCTFEYAWEAAPATHAYTVYFVGAEGCNNHKPSFKSPAEPKLKVTPTVINPDCDVTKYTLRLDLTYTNQRGNNILANVDGGADVTKANAHKSEAAEAEEFILIENLPADGKEHTFNLRFDDSDDCDTLNVKFTAPYSPQIGTAKAAVQPYKCGDEKYKVKVEVSFANGQGHNLIIEDWKGNKQSIPTMAADAKKEYTFEYAWEATPATHAYKFYFVGAEGCNNHTASFKSPAEPKLTVTPTVLNPDCDVTTYSLRLDLKYTNQRGSNIFANVDGGADVTKANAHKSEAAEAEEFILIENLPADGKEHTFNLRFDDSDDCDTLNGKFTAPYSPKIGNTTAFVQSYACGDNTYEAIVAVHFENGQGHNLIIEDWNGNKQPIATAVEDTEVVHRFEYAWEAPTTHAYKIYFVGAETCGKYKGGFEVPLWHHIDTVTVESDATVPCNDPTFNANVTIKTPYDITGVDLVLTYDDNGEKTTYAKGTGTSTVVPLVLHTIEGPDQTITVTFLADPACGKTSDAFTPAKRAGCLKDEVTVCEGDTYTWFGQDYTRPVGVDTITHGYDSLFLTVKAKPHITLQAIDLTCEDVATIALPYTVDKGEPNTFSLTVDGKAQDIIKVTATDIFIPSFEPGPHHAEVTVGVAGITCETTDTLDFTVAIAEQVYSKWTDVLFVSNKEGRYTAYQWFANNKSMEGETMQRLYDPDGLSGNNIVYYCQLTTTDGKTLYTCPKVFEEVTPSRTQDTGDKKVQSIRIYDNMGRSISGTPNNGIYIIVEQLEDGDTRVRKIAVYE